MHTIGRTVLFASPTRALRPDTHGPACLRIAFACLAAVVQATFAGEASTVASCPQKPSKSTEAECGKYPASLVIKTRTACTYPAGLHVFTLVGAYSDFTARRAADGSMYGLPDGMRNRRTSALLWGEYGITDRLQCGIALPYVFREYRDPRSGAHARPDGLGDMWAYTKFRALVETPSRPGVALDAWVKLPTGDEDKGLGNGEVDVKLSAEISKRYRWLSFHFNPEYTLTGGGREEVGAAADDRTTVNVGVIVHWARRVLPMIEANGLWWGDVGHEVDVGGGFLFFLSRNASLKVGVSIPVDVDMPWAVRWMPWVKLAAWF
ncbi:MAG: hypothetical protein GXP31_04350 [Kiritimatiellaeota bacterium]|nr:hypothetical protein [Kiritimatiellota bacterium]